jgi:hypothetical protein
MCKEFAKEAPEMVALRRAAPAGRCASQDCLIFQVLAVQYFSNEEVGESTVPEELNATYQV